MLDLRCSCGKKIAEYDDTTVSIMDKKCKTVTTLKVVDGRLVKIDEPIDHAKEIKKEIDRLVWEKPRSNELVRLKPIEILEITSNLGINIVCLYGEYIGIVIDNRMCVCKQKVVDLVHDIELFEKMVKKYEKLPIKIIEIEYN